MRRVTVVAALAALALAGLVTAAANSAGQSAGARETEKAVFFAADGLRQDLVEKYARVIKTAGVPRQ